MVGGIWYQLPTDSYQGILSRNGLLMVASTGIRNYLFMLIFVNLITADLAIFDRERADNMYGVIPYILGTRIAWLPYDITFSVVYSSILYFMAGLRTDEIWHFFVYVGIEIMNVYFIMGTLVIFI